MKIREAINKYLIETFHEMDWASNIEGRFDEYISLSYQDKLNVAIVHFGNKIHAITMLPASLRGSTTVDYSDPKSIEKIIDFVQKRKIEFEARLAQNGLQT